jgi:hypothetical protein
MDSGRLAGVSGIGVLNERPLHASIKEWYARPGDRLEVAVGRFVIDVVRDDLLIEIQTGNFASIKAKLSELVHAHQVRLIYPIAQEKWIVRSPTGRDGDVVRRKSPKRGRWEDVFRQVVSFPHLLANPNLSIEVLLIKEEEARRYEGRRRWRRGGWAIEGRRLLGVSDRRLFHGWADWRACIPAIAESFTAADLADALDTRLDLAQKMAYCLHKAGVTELIGKRGRSKLYRVLPATTVSA